LKKAGSEDDEAGGTFDDDGAVFGGARDPKRRRVAKGLDDPFGGLL